MSFKRKLFTCFTLLSVCAALLPGCGKKPESPFTIHSEDCAQGNLAEYRKAYADDNPNAYTVVAPILKTEQGYYDNAGDKNLRLYYHDISSGKDILLCNKPECKHDGNEFCVATNAKYEPLAYQIYDGYLYVAAKCLQEEKLEFKLLRIAPDGSSLTEVATYYGTLAGNAVTADNDTKIGIPEKVDSLLIHRNKAILPFSVEMDEVTGKKAYGTAILDLETKEVTYADENTADEENLPWLFLSAHGDYVYYVRIEDRKRVLHRRSLKDGMDESFSLLTNFTGEYAVLNDDAIAYLRTRGKYLTVYHPSDASNEEHTVYSKKGHVFHMTLDEETGDEIFESVTLETIDPIESYPSALSFDGTYLYVITYPSSLTIQPGHVNAGMVYEGPAFALAHVYDENLKELHQVPIPNPNLLLDPDGYNYEMDPQYNVTGIRIRFLGDEVVYVYLSHVFSCKMDSFLSEKPDFQYVYDRHVR